MSTLSNVALDQIGSAGDDRILELLDSRPGTIKRRGWLIRRALLISDIVGLVLAFAIAEASLNRHTLVNHLGLLMECLLFTVALPSWVVAAKVAGLYDHDEERADHSTADDVLGVIQLVTLLTWVLFAGAYVTRLASPAVPKLVGFWALAIFLIPTLRSAARAYCRRRLTYLQNAIIVGVDPVAIQIARKLLKHPEYGINLVGFVDSRPVRAPLDGELAHVSMLGDFDDVEGLVQLLDVERVIVAFPEYDAALVDLVRQLNELDVQVDIVPRLYEVLGTDVDVHAVEGLPLIGLRPPHLSRSSALLKRTLDLIGAGVGLVVLSPLLALAAIAIAFDTRGPVIYRQVRMGSRNRTFRIFKLRTMVDGADEQRPELEYLNKHRNGDARMFKIEGDPRVTRVGRILRRFSIDELPQLLNVLLGDMSLVGPRPLVLDEDAHVGSWKRRRLDLRPGITGLWQVLGRDEIPFEEMVRLDYVYVTSWSLGGDIRLLLRTIPRVVAGPESERTAVDVVPSVDIV